MPNVNDIATYILQKQGSMTAMKLQKLVYYTQAWSLVWDESPLFEEPIQAWANGPVVPTLYFKHQGQYLISSCDGNPNVLSDVQKETIDAVLKTYGDKSSQWLSDLTHKEDPWIKSRIGLAPGERGSNEIKLSEMAEYYAAL